PSPGRRAAPPPRPRRRGASAAGRAPCAPPCGRGSRLARWATAPPPSRWRAATGASTSSPRPGTAAAPPPSSCLEEDAPCLGEVGDAVRRVLARPTVVGVGLPQHLAELALHGGLGR